MSGNWKLISALLLSLIVIMICSCITSGETVSDLNSSNTSISQNMTDFDITSSPLFTDEDNNHPQQPLSKIIFVSERDGNQEIYIMNSDGSEQENLTRSTNNEFYPQWSPDGKKISFVNKIQKEIDALVYSTRGLRETSDIEDFYEIFFLNTEDGGINKLEENALSPEVSWSPDSTQIAYTNIDGRINVLDIISGNVSIIPLMERRCFEPSFSPEQLIIACESYNLYIWNLETQEKKQLTSLSPVAHIPNSDYIIIINNIKWSLDGEKIAFKRLDRHQLNLIKKDGTSIPVPQNMAINNYTWSPDSSRIAFNRGNDIYILDIDNKKYKQITNSANIEGELSWSADGSQIAFAAIIDNQKEIFVMNSDGSNQIRLTNNNSDDFQPEWSPY
jgi:Tol biopolymer transport system component